MPNYPVTWMKYSIAFVMLFLCALTTWSQKLPFKHLTVAQGLPQSQVTALEQDEFGYLWIGTQEGGLCRFDGRHFTYYSMRDGLHSAYVRNICYSDNQLWIGTDNGINILSSGKITDGPVLSNQLEDRAIIKIVRHQAAWWIATFGGGVFTDKDGRFRRIDQSLGLTTDIISDMEVDSNGRLWLSSLNGSIFSYSEGSFHKFPYQHTTPIISLLPTADSIIYIGTLTEMLRLVPQDDLTYLPEATNVKGAVHEIVSKGEELFALPSYGFFRGNDTKFQWVAEEHGFTNFHINCMLVDREGVIWFGARIDGLYKFLGDQLQRYSFPDNAKMDIIMAIQQVRSGDLYVATLGKGLHKIDPRLGRSEQIPIPGIQNIGTMLLARDQSLWLGSFEQGVLQLKDNYPIYPSFNVAESEKPRMVLGENMQGGIYMAAPNILYEYKNKNLNKLAKQSGINTLFQRQTSLLLGTRFGLFSNETGSWKRYNPSLYPDSTNILSITEDEQGNLFIGTMGSGLHLISGDTVIYYGKEHGLSGDNVYFLLRDENILYCGGQSGITMLELNADLSIKSVQKLSMESGFLGGETNQNAAYQDQENTLWFGSVDGVYNYSPNRSNWLSPSPVVNIIQVDHQNYPLKNMEIQTGYNWFNVPDNTRLRHDQNTVRFQFHGLSSLQVEPMLYQYRILGVNNDWTNPTVGNEVVYSNLKPGAYRFEVQGILTGDVRSPVATFDFVIIPPLWKTPWFIVILAITTFMILILINRLLVAGKLKKVLQYERIREETNLQLRKELAMDFHDEVGNHLASIMMLVQIFRSRITQVQNGLKESVQRLEYHAENLDIGTRDFIWSVDPENKSWDTLYFYLKDFADELFEASNITFDATLDKEKNIKTTLLNPKTARHCVLIIKEAFTNVLKHSQASHVIFRVVVSADCVILDVLDNGIGIRPGHRLKQTHGLESMQQRARKMGATLKIASQQKGVLIQLQIAK